MVESDRVAGAGVDVAVRGYSQDDFALALDRLAQNRERALANGTIFRDANQFLENMESTGRLRENIMQTGGMFVANDGGIFQFQTNTDERRQLQESDRSMRKASATLNKLLPPWRRLRLKIQGKIVMRGESGLIWRLGKGSRIIRVHFQHETFGGTYVPECQGNTASDCPWEDWAAGIYLRIKSGIKGEAEIIRTSGIGDGASFYHFPGEIVTKLIPAPSLVSIWGRMRRRRKEILSDAIGMSMIAAILTMAVAFVMTLL